MPNTQPPAAQPTPIALVVCENVYSDPTGKKALVGLFNSVAAAPQGPTVVQRVCIYVSFTEVYARTVIELVIENAETEQAVVSAKTDPSPPNIAPNAIVEFVFGFPNVCFPQPGIYFAKLKANGLSLLETPIHVTRTQRPRQNEHDNH